MTMKEVPVDYSKISDETALKKAIRAAGRGDAAGAKPRVDIAKRAKVLRASDLIPDNWNPDGSLSDAEQKGHLWTAEQRDTANDVFTALDGVLSDAYEGTWCVWVQDWYGDGEDVPYTVVYYYAGDIYATTFAIDDDGKYLIAVDVARKVRPCTTYIDRSAPKPTEQRAMPKSLEWRKQRADGLQGKSLERRSRFERFEIRENDDETLHFTGYASLTNTPYDMGWYTETVNRGAFKKTLAEDPDVVLLLNHDGLPMARTKAGTMRLEENDLGLKVDADLDAGDPDSQRLKRKRDRGDLDGQMSFAFSATRQSWNEDYTERSLNEVSIHRGDVSIVTQGASPTTFSSIRSDDALMALRHMGPIGFLEAMLDLRRYSGTPKEQRAGMTLSAATTEVLTQILNLCAIADDAMDQAQPILADLMGVPNPDEDDDTDESDDDSTDDGTDDDGEPESTRGASLALEARRRMEALRYPRRGTAA